MVGIHSKDEDELFELKKEVEKLNIDHKVQITNFNNAMKELKKDYSIDTVAKAEQRSKDLDIEIGKLKKRKILLITKIRNELDKYDV